MIDIDVIVLTNSKDKETISMTKRTMISMQEAEKNYKFHFHLVESGFDSFSHYGYLIDNYIIMREKFNYNKFINNALKYTKHDWLVISNNDVGYEKNWFSEIMQIHDKRPDIESFSPKDPMLYMKYFDWHFIESIGDYFESYIVSEAIMGWCLAIKRSALDKITPFDEQFDMYYQDNDYEMMLRKNDIKHALVRHSIACHLGTLKVEQKYSDEKKKKMEEDFTKFLNKWHK